MYQKVSRTKTETFGFSLLRPMRLIWKNDG